jgi:hypothetical protein
MDRVKQLIREVARLSQHDTAVRGRWAFFPRQLVSTKKAGDMTNSGLRTMLATGEAQGKGTPKSLPNFIFLEFGRRDLPVVFQIERLLVDRFL